MLEGGCRFADNLYINTSFDPDDGTCIVSVEFITGEGVKQTMTGAVEWDDSKKDDKEDKDDKEVKEQLKPEEAEEEKAEE